MRAAISRDWAIEWTKVKLLPIETPTLHRLQLGPTLAHHLQLDLTCPPQMFACISPAQIQTTVRNVIQASKISCEMEREFVYACAWVGCVGESERERGNTNYGEKCYSGIKDFV